MLSCLNWSQPVLRGSWRWSLDRFVDVCPICLRRHSADLLKQLLHWLHARNRVTNCLNPLLKLSFWAGLSTVHFFWAGVTLAVSSPNSLTASSPLQFWLALFFLFLCFRFWRFDVGKWFATVGVASTRRIILLFNENNPAARNERQSYNNRNS